MLWFRSALEFVLRLPLLSLNLASLLISGVKPMDGFLAGVYASVAFTTLLGDSKGSEFGLGSAPT